MSLKGKIALVTGASRGCGRGTALSLGSAQSIVYITALRPEDEDEIVKSVQHELPTLEQVADEINKRGGKEIAIHCDHSKPEQVAKVFEQIAREQNGQLDILVINAFAAVTKMLKIMHTKFYELPEEICDTIMDVRLKGHYICARHAAKLMVPGRQGLIVTVSSFGGASYIFNVAYGVNKSGCDRLAADMAIELRGFGITSVRLEFFSSVDSLKDLSLWPGAVRTELFSEEMPILSAEHVKKHYKMSEGIEFAGKCVVVLANDEKRLEKSGQILLVQELAKEYGVKEEDGNREIRPVCAVVEQISSGSNYSQKIVI